MNFIVFSGPPSSGKTSVILKTISALKQQGISVGVVKFDCLHTDDDKLYEKEGVLVRKGLSGALCPDHFFASNIEEVVQWGNQNQLDLLITESAGLCNRCSPYLAEIKGVSPIVLIDEIENAGIDREKALRLLVSEDKIVLMATHDPLLALMADHRIVIKNGGIHEVLETTEEEKELLKRLTKMDAAIQEIRQSLRRGNILTSAQLL